MMSRLLKIQIHRKLENSQKNTPKDICPINIRNIFQEKENKILLNTED